MKKNTNRIPRKAIALNVTWKIDSLARSLGERATVFRENNAWHCFGNDGKLYLVPTAYLHNENLCEITDSYDVI